MTNLQIRILSALFLAAAALGLTWLGGLPFRLLSAIIAAAVFYEWSAMRGDRGAIHRATAALCLTVVLGLLLADCAATTLLAATAVAVTIALVHGVVSANGLWNASGIAYAALSGISLALVRDGDRAGLFATLFLFAVVWATDISAYFVGRSLGGPKLAPAISPGKTWSGAIGGTAGGVAAGMAVALATGWGGAWACAVALLLAVVAQLGDLFESFVKRRSGVKDSSHIIPGHGGVMDRVDGLVAAAFTLYVIGVLFGGADNPASGLVGG